ncbi:unnamed protein product, partial [Natator depressus]
GSPGEKQNGGRAAIIIDLGVVWLADYTQGKLHPLQNDSACKTWVSRAPGGSVRVNASYAGCYVIEVPPAQNGEWSSRPNFEE